MVNGLRRRLTRFGHGGTAKSHRWTACIGVVTAQVQRVGTASFGDHWSLVRGRAVARGQLVSGLRSSVN